MIQHLAATIIRQRESRGLTQHQVAMMCGITRPQVANIEGGRSWPSAEALIRMAILLDFDVRQIR